MGSSTGGWEPDRPEARPWDPAQGPTYAPPGVTPEQAAALSNVAPTAGLSTAVIVLIAVAVLIAVVAVVVDLMLFARAETILARPLDESMWIVVGAAALVQFLLVVLALVLLLVWLHRSWRNAKTLGILDLPFSAASAVGGWFVPFLNFVRPFQSMRDVERASRQLASGERTVDWSYLKTDRKVTVWWIFVLTSWVLRLVVNNDEVTGDVTAALRRLVVLDMVANVLYAAAGVLLILVVRQVTRAQAEAVQRRGGGSAGL